MSRASPLESGTGTPTSRPFSLSALPRTYTAMLCIGSTKG